MNFLKHAYCRIYQTAFRAAIPFLPYREPAILHQCEELADILAKEHIEKPSDVLKVGQEITAKVVDLNVDEKKISLSMKALLAEEATDDQESSEE